MEEEKIYEELRSIFKDTTNWVEKCVNEKRNIFTFFPVIYPNLKESVLFFPIFEEINNAITFIGFLATDRGYTDFAEFKKDGNDTLIENKSLIEYKDKKYNELIAQLITIIKIYSNGKLYDEIDENEFKAIIDKYSYLLLNLIKDKTLNNIYAYLISEKIIKDFETRRNNAMNKKITNNAVIINAKNGLRYVSDKALKIATVLQEKGNISIRYVENEKKEKKLVINNNIMNLCNCDTDSLYDAIVNNNNVLDSKEIFGKNKTDFTIKVDRTFSDICLKCKHQKCPKILAAYIQELKSKNMLKQKLDDREEFRKNNETNDWYEFNINSEYGLKEVPENVFEFCKEISDNGNIFIDGNLVDGKYVKIWTKISCSDIKLLNYDIDKLKEMEKENKKWVSIVRNPMLKMKVCSSNMCGLDTCPLEIAAYIYYLNKIGKKDIIEKEREYYSQNKEEIDKKLEEGKQNKLKELIDKKNDYIEELTSQHIENAKVLIDTIFNTSQTNLHCIVEGKEEKQKENCINKIVTLLDKNRKLSNKIPIRITLRNLAVYNLYIEKGMLKYVPLKENTVYIISKIGEFVNEYKTLKESQLYSTMVGMQFRNVMDLITDLSKNNYIILEGEEKEIEGLFQINSKMKFVYPSNKIYKFEDISVDEMFDLFVKEVDLKLLDDLRKDNDKYKKLFEEYVMLNKSFIPLNNREIASYLSTYVNSIGKLELPENIYKKETVDNSLKQIIGLEEVKEKIKEFEKYMLFQVKAKNKGIKIKNINLHMIFTGNPGTGKTTVARIMAKMLFDLGITSENKLIEVERKDLIAEYVGQTAIKTSEVIDKAMGGVLFIDEAYSLTQSGSKNDYGSEAVATLIKAMEDNKDKFVVIFAGYKNEMQEFLGINPGIRSRIGYTFDFKDYTDKELVEILYKKSENAGFKILDEAKEPIEKVIKFFCNVEEIGNGRFVDRVLQEIIIKHAKNENEEIDVITKEDIPTIKEITNVINAQNMIDPDKVSKEDLMKTAIHETGHAVLRLLLTKKAGIKKITINAEGTGSLGYVEYEAIKEKYTSSKEELLNRIKVCLGGMVAEKVFIGYYENGATSDLSKATNIAKNIVTRYGMSDLGYAKIDDLNNGMAPIVYEEINKILGECFKDAEKIITENKEKIQNVIDYLYEHKEIEEEQLIANFK